MNEAPDSSPKEKIEIKRIGRAGYLHTIIPILDSSGKVVERIVKPLMVELTFRDIIQIFVGATLLAFPMAFTEETWNLGQELPLLNVVLIAALSIFFIAIFVYVHFYKNYLKGYAFQYIKRVISIYAISLVVVAMLMTLIQQCPWDTDILLSIKRIIIVAFPASMSAVATDALK